MALMAVVIAQQIHPRHRTSTQLDSILIQGDHLYSSSYQNQTLLIHSYE